MFCKRWPAKTLRSPEGEAITLDYAATGLSLRRHPLALLRPRLAQRRSIGAVERRGMALLHSRLLAVAGQWQSKDGSTHLIARRLVDVTPWLSKLATRSRVFQ